MTVPVTKADASPAEVQPGPRGFPLRDVYRGLRLVIFDVDGVLTDGRVALGQDGAESKFFDIRDGTGFTLLRMAGLETALLSGRFSHSTNARARELQIPPERVCQGVAAKLPAYQDMVRKAGLLDSQIAFVGDDIIDLPVLRKAGLACCPADARPEVLAAAHAIAQAPGGRGAARLLCEHLLKQRLDGTWERILEQYQEGA